MSGYIGTTPVPQATQHREAFTANADQTTFATAGYTVGYIDVWVNGVKLAAGDMTVTNGSDIVLASAAAANDIIEYVAFVPFNAANQTFTGATVINSLNINSDGATVTGIKDEDNMASNDANKLATQQSIKAYVDAQVTAQDLDFQGDSGGVLNIDLDSETLDIAGGTNITTAGSGNTVTVNIAPLDEDNMASNSATQVASQQSIKAYVDSTVAATNEVVEDTTPQLGGDLASNGNDILMADSDKAIFGAGSDLQLFHDGSNSYIIDNGTGDLLIRGVNINLQSTSGEDYINCTNNGGVTIRHDLASKLNTTSTGINVTGTVTSDGLTVDGAITSSAGATITTADNTAQLTVVSTDADAGSGPQLHFYRNSASPADGDGTGLIKFIGKNNAGEDVDYATIDTWPIDVSDGTEDGEYNIRTMVAGSSINRMQITRAETVFNQGGSGSVDFRIESGNNANMLVVNAGDDQVIIGGDTQKTTDWQSDARGLTVVGVKPTIALHDQDNANYVSFISQVSGDQYIYNLGGGKVYFGISETPGSSPATYMTVSDYGAVTKPLQPAFSVHKNGTAQYNFAVNTNVVLTWTHQRFDQNSDFDFVNSRFTAPVTGKYQFNANIRLDNIHDSADYYLVFLATSNENYRFAFDPDLNGDKAYWSVSISVLADMDNGDTATFKVHQGGGSAQTDIQGSAEYTHFSGYLAC